jgi:hypothetical protein
MANEQTQDPMEFVRQLWGNMGFSLPGMVTPTFDTLELTKRIADLRAVEGWLRMNLSMLQMTIQGLEMQNTTLATVQSMSKIGREEEVPDYNSPSVGETLQQAALWPWSLMQQMQDHLQQSATEAEAETPAEAPQKATAAASKATSRKPAKKSGS